MAESHHVSLDHFAEPGLERTRRHKLVDIRHRHLRPSGRFLGAAFGRSKLEWFQTFRSCPGGFPPMFRCLCPLDPSSRVASWPPKPSPNLQD